MQDQISVSIQTVHVIVRDKVIEFEFLVSCLFRMIMVPKGGLGLD